MLCRTNARFGKAREFWHLHSRALGMPPVAGNHGGNGLFRTAQLDANSMGSELLRVMQRLPNRRY
jgi:hypothetical protein